MIENNNNSQQQVQVSTEGTEQLQKYSNFDDLDLKFSLLKGIYGKGYTQPSAIQQIAIKPIIDKRDILAQAQSGSGKTATFLIGALQRVDESVSDQQVLIILPTRELAGQIFREAEELSKLMNIKIALLVGGTSQLIERQRLQDGCQLIIGTPGKIKGMIQKGLIAIQQIKILIIDEADEMLSLGFIEQINDVIGSIDPQTQVCFFSATMPEQVLEITEKALSNPVKILVKSENVTLEGISQYHMSCADEEAKFNALMTIFKNASLSQCFIYFNSKERCENFCAKLKNEKVPCEFMHGGLDMEIRNDIMSKFRNGEIKLLLTTDLLARGIDITQCGLVINVEFPMSMENYIHRIGRSGRFGRRGVAINLVSPKEVKEMMEVEKFYQTKIGALPEDINGTINKALAQ